MLGFNMRKSRGIPNNWMPNENKFRKECAEFKIRELAKKYNVCIDTICDWKKEFDISHGRLKPKKIKWVVESTGCWRCTSHKANTSTGYVYIRKDKLVSKILYERKFGKIKGNGKCMLHKSTTPHQDARLVTMLARSSSRSEALSSSHATKGWLTTNLLALPLARQAILREALRSL